MKSCQTILISTANNYTSSNAQAIRMWILLLLVAGGDSSVGNASDLVTHRWALTTALVVQILMHVRGSRASHAVYSAYTVYTHIGGKGRCRTRGESEGSVVRRRGSTQARESTLALKPRADITRSPKQGYQWPREKDMLSYKVFKKKKKKKKKILLLFSSLNSK